MLQHVRFFARSFLIVVVVATAIVAAETSAPKSAVAEDPMAWSPPENPPAFIEREPYDDKARQLVLTKLQIVRDNLPRMPERGMKVAYVTPGGQADTRLIRAGDICVRLDDKPLHSPAQWAAAWDADKDQVLEFFSLQSFRFEKALFTQGAKGLVAQVFNRDNPLVLDDSWKDPRWKDDVQVAAYLCELSPDLAETALAHAVTAGLPRNAALYSATARIHMSAHRYTEAMNFAWYGLKERPQDRYLINLFIHCAAANYKLEALVTFLKGHPDLHYFEDLSPFQKLIDACKIMSESQRIILPPSVAWKVMFADDLLLRAERVPSDAPLIVNPKLDEAGQNEEIKNYIDSERLAEKELEQLERVRTLRFSQTPQHYSWVGFKPAVENIYLRCVLTLQPTEKTQGEFINHFRLALLKYDDQKKNYLPAQGSMLGGLGLSLMPGYQTIMQLDHPMPELTLRIANQFPQANRAINSSTTELEIIIIVLDGNAEVLFNGGRIFYGPSGFDHAKLIPTWDFVGTTGRIKHFEAYELLTDKERDAKLIPAINAHYRRGLTRLHSAALHADKSTLEELIRLGATFDAKDAEGLTVLQRAIVDSGHYQLLIDLGVEPDFYSRCALFTDPRTVELIKSSPPPQKDAPLSPLFFSAYNRGAYIAKKLIDKGYAVNQRSASVYKDSTPLHWAVLRDNVDMALLLLNKGADLALKDSDGRTPLDLANQGASENMITLLTDWQSGKHPPWIDPGIPLDAPASPQPR